MWIDFINQTVKPASKRVLDQVYGNTTSNQRDFSVSQNELKETLANLE